MSQIPTGLPAEDIDGVIDSLDRIIEWAKDTNHRCGYFAALYRKVTIRVKQGIEKNEFADGARMERLDVFFANRYLDAFESYHQNKVTTTSWRAAFDAAEKRGPIVLQHLLLGMNAHIGLDLGIAAAQTVPPSQLADLEPDFEKINSILSSLVNQVQDDLARIWPLLKVLDRFAGTVDEHLSDILMQHARQNAWHVAERMAATPEQNRLQKIQQLDREVSGWSRLILTPHLWLRLFLWVVRLGESRSVAGNIHILHS
jgi:hypothetical protein